VNLRQQALRSVEFAINKCGVEDQLRLAIADLSLREDSTWRCIGSKFRWMRSTPTESVSTRLKLLVCWAKTGMNIHETKFPKSSFVSIRASRVRNEVGREPVMRMSIADQLVDARAQSSGCQFVLTL